MRNIVLVLGAGASYEFKAPLMKDFYNFAASLYVNENSNQLLKERFDTVFSFIDRLQKSQAKANIDLHNIESVYTALEMAKLLGLDDLKSKKSQSWKELDQAMKFFLSKVIESRVTLPHNDTLPRHRQPTDNLMIGPLLNQTPEISEVLYECTRLSENNWNVSIITFNYDLVTESILASLGYDVDYRLPNEQHQKHNKSIPVLKLHGSMNWYKSSAEDKKKYGTSINSIPIRNRAANLNEKTKYFKVNRKNEVKTSFSENLESIIVPPVWNKSSYHQEIREIWREAANSLSESSHIYCLGYSLPQTDGFFKQLFALGTVGFRPLQDFGVFDIEPEDKPQGVCSRYMSMLGRGSENVFSYSNQGAKGLKERLKELY